MFAPWLRYLQSCLRSARGFRRRLVPIRVCVTVGHRPTRASSHQLRLGTLEDRVVLSGTGTWTGYLGGMSPRWGAPAVSIGPDSTTGHFRGTYYLFGGTDSTTVFSDLWSVDSQTMLWTQLHPSSLPPARHDHAAVNFNDKMFIFGGEDGATNILNDVWSYDPTANSWQQVPTTGSITWPGAMDATAVTVGQEIIVFGGAKLANGTLAAATPYAFNPTTGAWTVLAADPLGGDASPQAAVFNGQVYVFSSKSSTIEVLDPVQDTWSKITVIGPKPTPRAYAAAGSYESLFWLAGGAGVSPADTWQFNFTTRTWLKKANIPVEGPNETFLPPGTPLQDAAGVGSYSSLTGAPSFTVFGGAANLGGANGLAATNNVERYQQGSHIIFNDFAAAFPNPRLAVAEQGGLFTTTIQGGSGTAYVAIPVQSSNPSEGTVSTSRLVLPPGGGKRAITIVGGADITADGDVVYQVQLGPIVSADPDLNGLTETAYIVARDLPLFPVNQAGSYVIADPSLTVAESHTDHLPPGMTFNASTNTLSGTPTRPGIYPLHFTIDAASLLTLTVTVAQPITITLTPHNLTVAAGQLATFTARASGFPTPTVQWQVSTDGGTTYTNIEGATSTALTFPATVLRNGDMFHAIFTNGLGSVTTGPVTLTVLGAPVITLQPTTQGTTVNGSATFTANATGNPAPTVQWRVSTDGGLHYTTIAGATSTTLTVSSVTQAQNGYRYDAVFTNARGSAITTAAVLVVGTAPQVTTQPAAQTVNAGHWVVFQAAATGSPTPAVQWQVSTDGGTTFQSLPGATLPMLRFLATAADNGNLYRALFTNAVGTTPSNSATLTVDYAARVTLQPVSQAVLPGSSVAFTVAANANPAATVQWQQWIPGTSSFTNMPGQTSLTLNLASVTQAQSGREYRAVFTNALGRVATQAATLTVTNNPVIITEPTSQTVAVGSGVSFTATANGMPAPTVQWQVRLPGASAFTNVPGATSTTLNLSNVALADSGVQYRAVFSSSLGRIISLPAILTVDVPLTITLQPTSEAVLPGQFVTFTATASGTAPTVQWQVSTNGGTTFTNIAGATSTSLTFMARMFESGYMYRAVFTNPLGQVMTNNARLLVW